MWQGHSEKRLVAWVDLRTTCKKIPDLAQVITNIHDWWQQAPMVMHYLHWDLVRDWPDPWDLIAENTYCDLAKCLGMCYTIHMLERQDINTICIQETSDNDYIVQVNNGLYVLNWNVDNIVNMGLIDSLEINRSMDSAVFAHKIR